MNYDLTDKQNRKKFVKRANYLLAKQRTNVALIDESKRTPNQNSYVHVLCRILAMDVGVSERYAKLVYFKEKANPEIFVSVIKDPITGKTEKFIRSTCDLTIKEMSDAIKNFFLWASEVAGYELPKATLKEDGSLVFDSEEEKQKFKKAQLETSKMDEPYPDE